jgi:hypothetical protein
LATERSELPDAAIRNTPIFWAFHYGFGNLSAAMSLAEKSP